MYHLSCTSTVITAAPAPNILMDIPKIPTVILEIFRFPLVTEALRIKKTGTKVKFPWLFDTETVIKLLKIVNTALFKLMNYIAITKAL